MPTSREIIWGLLTPAVASAILLLAGAIIRRPRPAGVLALAGGFALAFAVFLQVPSLPPHEGEGWLFWWLIPAAAVAMLDRLRFITIFAAPLVLILVTWSLLRPVSHTVEPLRLWSFILVAAIAMVVWWLLVDSVAGGWKGAGPPLLLGFVFAGAALVLTDAGLSRFGTLTGVAALLFWVAAAVDGWRKQSSLHRGGTLIAVVLLEGLLLIGHFYADVSVRDTLLLAAAPLGLIAGALPLIRRRPLLRLMLAAIPVLGLTAIAAVPAAIHVRQTISQELHPGE